MDILITGSDGVIGKEIANELKKIKKYKFYLMSNKKRYKNRKKIKIFYQNLTRPIKLKLRPHTILHCASKHPFSISKNSMRSIYKINLKMTKNLIEFSNKNSVKNIFFFSSIDAYGKINNKVVSENLKPLNPSLYGRSKLLSEKLLCQKKNKFKAICLRIPGIFNFDLKKNYPLIIRILKKIISNKNVEIYNPNAKFNNILDVKEIVKFINILLQKKRIKSEIYNFAASNPIKFIRVVNLIKKKFQSKSKIIKKKSKKISFIISNNKLSKTFNFKISDTEKVIARCCNKIINKDFLVNV